MMLVNYNLTLPIWRVGRDEPIFGKHLIYSMFNLSYYDLYL